MGILKFILSGFVLMGTTVMLSAEETITVRPEDTGRALINPGMGWTMHFYSNVARNYGSKLEPSDTLDDFPGVSTVYLRLPWDYLEPDEGRYHWAIDTRNGYRGGRAFSDTYGYGGYDWIFEVYVK